MPQLVTLADVEWPARAVLPHVTKLLKRKPPEPRQQEVVRERCVRARVYEVERKGQPRVNEPAEPLLRVV